MNMEREMAEITLSILEETLSDGSIVYNVSFKDAIAGTATIFPAVTHNDALALAEKIESAVNQHTNFNANFR